MEGREEKGGMEKSVLHGSRPGALGLQLDRGSGGEEPGGRLTRIKEVRPAEGSYWLLDKHRRQVASHGGLPGF